jgi:hypothetical protein
MAMKKWALFTVNQQVNGRRGIEGGGEGLIF